MDTWFEGARVKRDRGVAQWVALSALMNEVVRTCGYRQRLTHEADGWAHLRWDLSDARPIPADEIAGQYADMVGNLRASLDHVIYAMALRNGADAPHTRTAFPLVQHERDWSAVVGDRLRHLTPDDVERVRQVQPFMRPGEPNFDMLVRLDRINNTSKHRLIVPAVIALQVSTLDIELAEPAGDNDRYEYRLPPNRPAVHNGELWAWRFSQPARLTAPSTPAMDIRLMHDPNDPGFDIPDMVAAASEAVDILTA